ncbi:MAG: hypothetical protein JRF33_12430 [Deltaproteobacteria bacterium]|nr:hypothetical protein [Deltaproteobacteria bacterium]
MNRLAAIFTVLAIVFTLVPSEATAGEVVCTTATLYAGNPNYEKPQDWPVPGKPALGGIPLPWWGFVFQKDKVIVAAQRELWTIDMSAKPLVHKRFMGKRERATRFNAGSCKKARLVTITGMALMPDGSLVVADSNGNGLLRVIDPLGPKCAVKYFVGNTKAFTGIDLYKPPNRGDIDGKGGAAQFRHPQWPVAGEKGEVYFVDLMNKKVKKAMPDGTVTTVARVPTNAIFGMTRIGKKLYLVGNTTTEGVVWEVNTENGEVNEIVKEREGKWGGKSRSSTALSAITHIDNEIIVANHGYLFQVSVEHGTIKKIAGNGDWRARSIPKDFNWSAETPALEMPLPYQMSTRMTVNSTNFLGYHDGYIYYSGAAAKRTPFTARIACTVKK